MSASVDRMEDDGSKDNVAVDKTQVVRLYLESIDQAARLLATPARAADENAMEIAAADSFATAATNVISTATNVTFNMDPCVNRIARHLLQACQLDVLASDTSNLPPKVYPQSDFDPLIPQGERNYVYEHRRIDYLRRLLQAMAPIALDVASRVASRVMSAPADTKQAQQQAAFLLFAVWLPLAQQITPLVSALFALDSFECPLATTDTKNTDTTTKSTAALEQEQWLLAQASHEICHYYSRTRQDHPTLLQWWNWSPVFAWITPSDDDDDVEMTDVSKSATATSKITVSGVVSVPDNLLDCIPSAEELAAFETHQAVRWHAVRAAAWILNLAPALKAEYFANQGVQQMIVPWTIHPWELDHDACTIQKLCLLGKTRIWQGPMLMPCMETVRHFISLHPFLVHLGEGLVFYRRGAISETGGAALETTTTTAHQRPKLVRTVTTADNLVMIGTALCLNPHPAPILLCGPSGSGKSSLVREISRLMVANSHASHDQHLLEIHVDEETDTKTLVGSYTATDIPGEFEWRPGALTRAIRDGKWVLMEDMDTVPTEIQASLVQLLKDRLLPLGNGKMERCHPDFRLFGTLTTHANGKGRGRKLLNPTLWHHVHVNPLPYGELKDIAVGLHPGLPLSVVESALNVFQAMDKSGRKQDESEEEKEQLTMWIGRDPSVRDLFKLFSRIEGTISFEKDVSYATESQRTLCLAETFDIFVAACSVRETRQEFLQRIAAPMWGVSADLASRYVQTRCPPIHMHHVCTEIGRTRIPVSDLQAAKREQSESFAHTGYALRLIESLGVCVRQNEPTLLVGETGVGKTRILQHLAKLSGRSLIVQNLSLQTDSTDLLGGYRPLEMQHVARLAYQHFVDLFTSTFSRKQNTEFLTYASSAMSKGQWKKLSQCFRRSSARGLAKVKELNDNRSALLAWKEFSQTAERFEQQRLACDSGLAFVFTEGALVEAIRRGTWVLLDEINLASSETLQRLCGLLDDSTSSLTLTERGDAVALSRHPEFRLFAAMNPATDSGKKDLNASVRSRFTEIYVDELLDPVELRMVAGSYLSGILPASEKPPEHTDIVIEVVDAYISCRRLAEVSLTDGSGQKPRYTLRTLTRALTASRSLVLGQKFPLRRALYEGFALAFQGALSAKSIRAVKKVLSKAMGKGLSKKEMEHPGRRPGGRSESKYVLVKPFWVEAGPLETVDWSVNDSVSKKTKFILTPTAEGNLRRLAQAVVSGPWPVLLEGPTSAGKTTLVEYLAARCGHRVIRINNHEHTDVQEYTGGFAADSSGSLAFHDGLLVRALRRGDWVILDELNLAPSEVLEALNRLLDDNRELYLPETNEMIKAHPSFRLFATQNPSGAYGGRKPLSRAFRNRFVEMHVADIPSDEMVTILELRCGCPPSHAKQLVAVMEALRQRRSRSGVFLGKDGFITPRDLLRWAERGCSSRAELAREGFMLLAERLRTEEEKECVKNEIEKHLNTEVELDSFYYGESSEARSLLDNLKQRIGDTGLANLLSSVAPTRSLLRLLSLVLHCIRKREPVLLVGDTGCGKTTAVQLLSAVLQSTLHVVNCHATTEISDLLGGLRPVRGRSSVAQDLLSVVLKIVDDLPNTDPFNALVIPDFLKPIQDQVVHQRMSDSNIDDLIRFAKDVLKVAKSNDPSEGRNSKRRKLACGGTPTESDEETGISKSNQEEVERLLKRYNSLFEWVDGPLVHAMKHGDMILLDEMSLAEDAVLERLNSVLEPSRTLVLAEKGVADDKDGSVVKAHSEFQIFATMNPGGDFGKRELSPALRSRFTEIWVPAVTDPTDIDLVVERSLASCLSGYQVTYTKMHILRYVDWFNNTMCKDNTSPCSELSLSLRDILTWARFVVATFGVNDGLSLGDLLLHGVRLMHLDGLGLGTGLSLVDVVNTREKAETVLLQGLDLTDQPKTSRLCSQIEVTAERLGAFPFWINVGPKPPKQPSFHFHAETTALNIQRVIRAMQLSKPVLLEGSPGVGKTTLIAALATASGHHLTRINLSEQTDIADLMGSDLPVPDDDSSSIVKASFQWCDGVLLSAIKHGDWVLLDELNLASQSVLEGLNSCLDHRASVYIPELGQTFECPPTFRVFAAQNPLAQGGGRKGLPKSFLNRFTKVHVDALSKEDMKIIASEVFPKAGTDMVDKMVEFNQRIHEASTVDNRLGLLGSPWEFNLRDIFRWCALTGGETSDVSIEYARDLYFLRFRTEEDRRTAKMIYSDLFSSGNSIARCSFKVRKEAVCLADVTLPRRKREEGGIYESVYPEVSATVSNKEPLQALARCVMMHWPALVVGGASAGKSSLIRTLADATNSNVVEIALSSSSDVSELVGCFEQVDFLDEFRMAMQSVLSIGASTLALAKKTQTSTEIARCLLELRRCVYAEHGAAQQGISLTQRLVSLLLDVCGEHICSADKKKLSSLAEKVQEGKFRAISKDKGVGCFLWKDGALVEAMASGHWLHLKNVNLCPSSVLDRLNPVMEPGGTLLLAEGGNDESSGESKHREIRCHQDFRIFLSMDPEHGEVSRAMRNRCVEISLIAPDDDQKRDLDNTVIARHSGVYFPSSSVLPSEIRSDSTRAFKAVGQTSSSMLQLGSSSSMLQKTHRHFVVNMDQTPKDCETFLREASTIALPGTASLRDGWSLSPDFGHAAWSARLLRMCIDVDSQARDNPKFFIPSEVKRLWEQVLGGAIVNSYQVLGFACFDDATAALRDNLLVFFLFRLSRHCSDHRYEFLSHLGGSLRTSAAMTDLLLSMAMDVAGNTMSSHGDIQAINHPVCQRMLQRIPHLLREYTWLCRNRGKTKPPSDFRQQSILDLSFFVSDGQIDRSVIGCPLLPLLLPLFGALDDWIEGVLVSDDGFDFDSLSSIQQLLCHRDSLWELLFGTEFRGVDGCDSVCFDTSDFIVQWMWILKSLRSLKNLLSTNAKEKRRNLDRLVESATSVLLERSTPDVEIGFSRPKWPVAEWIPRKRVHLQAMDAMRQVCSAFTFSESPARRSDTTLSLSDLIDSQSALLPSTLRMKQQALSALCTANIAFTKEIRLPGLDGLLGSLNGIQSNINSELHRSHREFLTKLNSIRIDPTVSTFENPLGLNELEAAVDKAAEVGTTYGEMSLFLLHKFATIQLAPFVQQWCENTEVELIRELSALVLARDFLPPTLDKLSSLRVALKHFIDVAVAYSLWNISDLRPFQTLLWTLESDKIEYAELKRFIQNTLPLLCSNSSKRSLSNAQDLLKRLSRSLEMSSLLDEEQASSGSQRKLPPSFALNSNVQDIFCSMVLSLLGDNLATRKQGYYSSYSFATIENQSVRKSQSRRLLGFISDLQFRTQKCFPFELSFLVCDTLRALKKTFPDGILERLLSMIQYPEDVSASQHEEFGQLAEMSTNAKFRSFVGPVLRPLFSSLCYLKTQAENTSKTVESAASAKLFVGFLRFHLLVPDSPLDPGRRPLSKMSLTESRLQRLGLHFLACQLDSAFVDGNLEVELASYSHTIAAQCKELLAKKRKQKDKVIERLDTAPSFLDLYREVRDFTRNFMDMDSILEHLTNLTSFDRTNAVIQKHIVRSSQWQITTQEFCLSLLSKYQAYEDIVIPLVGALCLVREGIGALLGQAQGRLKSIPLLKETLEMCFHFPFTPLPPKVATQQLLQDDQQAKEGLRDLSLCILSRLQLASRVNGIGCGTLSGWVSILDRLTKAVGEDLREQASSDSPEEALEKAFREQFPDHRKEFSKLLDADREWDDADEESESDFDVGDDGQVQLDGHQQIFLSLLHERMFSEKSSITDHERLQIFQQSYDTGRRFYSKQFDGNAVSLCNSIDSGMTMALLAAADSGTKLWNFPHGTGRSFQDFQREPNPAVAAEASEPIRSLLARLVQLLTAFPGNSILLAVVRVLERVKRFNIHYAPIGKIMTGLEVVLKHAQDWEQHASSRVRLGDALVSISRIVSKWRKLELSSWSDLLRAREEEKRNAGRLHWIRIHCVIRELLSTGNTRKGQEKASEKLRCLIPQWVFMVDNTEESLSNPEGNLRGTIQLLDTFCQSSPLGEFPTRLEMLRCFAAQVELEAECFETEAGLINLARSLRSIFLYYKQFAPVVAQKLDELRRPLEERMKKEIKLAKWDEQTYYALAEATERNHRTLMKILREHGEILEMSVGLILESHLCEGIRDSANTETQFCAQMPNKASFFRMPFAKDAPVDRKLLSAPSQRRWADFSKMGISGDSPLGKIGHFYRKINVLRERQNRIGQSHAEDGFDESCALSDAIFNRIESLRAKKATRPMKERALVDLMREMKIQGFASTNWSLPVQVQQMGDLFQLPSFVQESISSGTSFEREILTSSEDYFQRILVEQSRLRPEATIYGSRHLTSSQTSTLQAYADHGLLLLAQQRCCIFRAIFYRDRIVAVSEAIANNEILPVDMSALREFHRANNLAMESGRQLKLFIGCSTQLLDRGKADWARDAQSRLSDLLCKDEKAVIEEQLPFVTESDLKKATYIQERLAYLSEAIVELRDQSNKMSCLPTSAFDTCLSHIDSAISLGRSIEAPHNRKHSCSTGSSSALSVFREKASAAVSTAVLSVQAVMKGITNNEDAKKTDKGRKDSIWEAHKATLGEWAAINLQKMFSGLEDLVREFQILASCAFLNADDRQCCAQLVGDIGALYLNSLSIVTRHLLQHLRFHRSAAKFQYVLLRVFRMLVAKGFCSDEEKDGDETAEGDASGLNFADDQDGTGMGEGDGKKDVTDQIEDEEQLLGLKGDDKNEDNAEQETESKELGKEEAEKGMEMEGDFEGELFDLPEDIDDDGNGEEKEDEEELDREMGDNSAQNEEVIDEKMWDESDEEDDSPSQKEEKFEKDSSVKGDAGADEMMTKEDNEGEDDKPEEKEQPNNSPEKPEDENLQKNEDATEDDDKINEDVDDNYEESHGMNIREETGDDEKENEDTEDQMELDDQLEMDAGSESEGNNEEEESEMPEDPVVDLEEEQQLLDEEEEGQQDDPIDEPQIATHGAEDEGKEDNADETPPDEKDPRTNSSINPKDSQAGLGVKSMDGKDAVEDTSDAEDVEGECEGEDETEVDGPGAADAETTAQGGSSSGVNQGRSLDNSIAGDNDKTQSEDIPNPLKSPGDATKFWHRKLNIIQSNETADEETEVGPTTQEDEDKETKGSFEYSGQNQSSTTQALGEVEDDDALGFEGNDQEVPEHQPPESSTLGDNTEDEGESATRKRNRSSRKSKPDALEDRMDSEEANNEKLDPLDLDGENEELNDSVSVDSSNGEIPEHAGNNVVSDLSQLEVSEDKEQKTISRNRIIEEEHTGGASTAEISEARAHWSIVQSETHALSRRLCEKLRLVMEPLVASKLRGDYRTGKRINMKRVIGYIASGYRKDKIWLRRTKPAKRNYRILLAVDDSESMLKTGAGEMALRALATLATGMSQLEIGEIGIASFGNQMTLVHPFHQPFTSESGANVVHNFRFDQKRTKTALCVESAMMALDEPGERASMQLMFMISDGRIERDSRDDLRRLIREMMDRNILLAMIIVEGGKQKDSIMSMKEVTFEKGKPKIKGFIEEYPFPYYILLDDMQTLPEVLGDVLRQWFEMLTRLQSNGT